MREARPCRAKPVVVSQGETTGPPRSPCRRTDARPLLGRARAPQSSRRPSGAAATDGDDVAFVGHPHTIRASCATSTTSTSPAEGGRELLGGKGIGLAEMTQLGVPVPAGFTITTEACRGVHARGRRMPGRARSRRSRSTSRALEERAGKRFGDRADPLLVSVRSGAAISMPGMMDTILNVGLDDDSVEGLARATRQPPLRLRLVPAADPDVRRHRRRRRRPPLRVGALVAEARARGRAGQRATEDDLVELVAPSRRSTRTRPARTFPQDAREQLARAVEAVFKSWDTPRAQVYRRAHEIPDDLGTAVNVVQMVFGNKGDDLGDRRRVHARPVHGRAGDVRRVPRQRPGRGRRRRHPHAAAAGADGGRAPGGARAVRRHRAAAGGALPRHAGRRVHGRGGDALPAADAHGEAHRGGRAAGCRATWSTRG